MWFHPRLGLEIGFGGLQSFGVNLGTLAPMGTRRPV